MSTDTPLPRPHGLVREADDASGLVVAIPSIFTDRLLLRAFRANDFEAYAANQADPVSTKYMGGPCDRRAAGRLFASLSGAWVLYGAGWWAVELRETSEVVANVGAFFRDPSPDVEIGWSVYRRFWGRGYGREGAAAALRFAFDTLDARRAVAHITAANVASVRVALKLGMHRESEADFYGEPIERYVIERARDQR